MNKSILVALLVFISLFTTVTILPDVARAKTLFVGGTGSGNHTTIQGAIDAASPGDTVYVYSGTYYEALVIDKPLSLVGESRENTTIHTQFDRDQTTGTVVHISGDWVNVSGFTLRQVPRLGWWNGVLLDEVENCTVSDNYILDNTQGIYLWISSHITVLNNDLLWNTPYGIWVRYSSGNTVSGNSVSSSDKGISLSSSHYNTITQNTIRDSRLLGVGISESMNNTILRNALHANLWGMELSHSMGNAINENHITSNGNGIRSYVSGLNRIYHNNLIGNTNQAYDDNDTNEWDDGYPSGGNYWDDHTGMDLYSGPNQDQPGSDGLVDTPRNIEGGQAQDRYPFGSPYPLTPPTAPRNLQAFPKNGGALLMWNPPASDGGFPVTNYVLYRGTAEGQEGFYLELGNVLTYTDKTGVPGQTYYYRVSAKNSLGEGPKSEGVNLTLNPAQPNSLPTCRILHPVPGQSFEVSEAVFITGSSTDYDGMVEKIEIRIGDGPWIAANGTGFWTYGWNTTSVSSGEHTIFARAFDGTNYSDEVSVVVVVETPHERGDPLLGQVFFWTMIALVIIIASAGLVLEARRRRKA